MKNTIDLCSLYQQSHRFRGVVFSNSTPIIRYATSKGLFVVKECQRNEYGVPLYRSMMLALKRRFCSQYYGYINSDILIDPSFFARFNTLVRFKKRHRVPVCCLGSSIRRFCLLPGYTLFLWMRYPSLWGIQTVWCSRIAPFVRERSDTLEVHYIPSRLLIS